MTDWPVGLSTGCFYQQSFFDCIEEIVHAGFGMLEICSSPHHLDYHDTQAVKRAADVLDSLGVEPYSLHAPFTPDIDITVHDHAARERAEAEMLQAARAAATLRVRHFVVHPGPERAHRPEEGERMPRLRNAAALLDRVAKYCREIGVRMVFENMLPHLMFGDVADILWIMGALGDVNVGTCLDTGHALLSGSIYRVMYKFSGHMQLIHANDNGGDRDSHLAPGEGTIDWPHFLQAVSQTGFHGGIILELAGDSGKPNGEVLQKARRARRYVRDITRMLAMESPPTVGVPLGEIEKRAYDTLRNAYG